MPSIGDTKSVKVNGRKNHFNHYMWHACIECGKERWVQTADKRPKSLKCNRCVTARWRVFATPLGK